MRNDEHLFGLVVMSFGTLMKLLYIELGEY